MKNLIESQKKVINKNKLIIDTKDVNEFFLKYLGKEDRLYLINNNDSKILNFLIKYIFHSKSYNLHLFLRKRKDYNKLNDGITFNLPKVLQSTKLIVKFINIFILNKILFKNPKIFPKEQLNKKIYFVIKNYFIRDIISVDELNIICRYKVILSLYPEDYDFQRKNVLDINNDIKNQKELFSLFDFLLSFTKTKLDDKNKDKFIKLIELLIKFIQSILKNNINNIIILSKNDYMFKLIRLSKISNSISNIINPFLAKIYQQKFNFDFFYNDLSEQFTLQKNDKIESLTKYLLAKNSFLHNLFRNEEHIQSEITINNGFIFNNAFNNGIICSLSDNSSKNFPSEGFSLVISFFITNNDKGYKYNIFSFYGIKTKEFLKLYIENDELILNYNSKKISLFSEIKIKKNYIFWLIFPNGNSKEIIVILNDDKKYIKSIKYPSFQYKEILMGFDKDFSSNGKSINNFEGILGSFIFFNICLINIKDKQENQNQDEIKIKTLKGNYEMIINVKNRRNLLNIDRIINLTLNKFQPKIIEQIEFIISPKSVGNIKDINNVKNNFICNYYDYQLSEHYFEFHFVSDNSIVNYITYPFEYKNSLLEFLNNHGLVYLHLELYFLIGALSLKIKEKKQIYNNISKEIYLDENEIKDMNENLNQICLLFFYIIESNNYSNRINRDKIIINNFFYSLNDFISIGVKFGFKLRKVLLSLIINNIEFLLRNNLLIGKCDFIFIYENYEIEDKEVFELFFNNLLKIIEEYYYDENKDYFKYIFNKLINFDKIYIEGNITKEATKKYSELIQKFLNIFIDNKEDDVLDNYLYNLEKIMETINTYFLDFKKKNNIFSDDYEDDNIQLKQDKIDDNINESKNILDFNKIYNIKLVYKYLKNLFIAIDSIESKKNFSTFCSGKKTIFLNFFKEKILFLVQEFDTSIYEYKYAHEKAVNKINKGYYSELIKCLCISFLDEFFIEKTYYEKKKTGSFLGSYFTKKVTNSFISAKKKFGSVIFNDNPNKTKSQSILNITGEKNENDIIDNMIIDDNINNNIDNDSTKDEKNYFDLNFKDFAFLKDIDLSGYTFMNLYALMYKKKINNRDILNLIKNVDNKYKPFELNNNFIFWEDDFIQNKHYFHIINMLIEKLDFDGNYESLKPCFELISILIIKICRFYEINNSENMEEILEVFFNNKNNSLFNISINNIIKLSNEINIEESSDKKDEEKKKFYNQFLNLFKDNMIKIIDSSLLKYKDPFYFIFINKNFIYNNIDLDYILGLISFMINKFISYIDEYNNRSEKKDNIHLDKPIIFEFNNKNLLLLLYKIIFYVTKRKILINNIQFINNIYKYLYFFLNNSKLLYLKILFPIGDNQSSFNKKLIIEIIYEILLEFCIEYIEDPKKEYLKCFEDLLCDILNANNFSNKRLNINVYEIYEPEKSEKNEKKKISKSNHSFFYIMDKISFKKEISFKIADKIRINTEKIKKLGNEIFVEYKNDFNEKENTYSVCIIFMIKILLSIRYLNELTQKSKNEEEITHLKNLLSPTFNILCHDCYKLNKKFLNLNPLISEGKYNNKLYEFFKNFIILDYKNNKVDINKYIVKLLDFANDTRYFSRVIYNYYGNIITYVYKNFTIMSKNGPDPDNKTEPSDISTNASEEPKIQILKKSRTLSKKTKINKLFNLTLISKKNNNKKKKDNNLLYIEKYRLKSDIIRIYFSLYFHKILNFDKDFIFIKKVYKYLYGSEIEDIDAFRFFNCPLKIKNYISKDHYFKPFLKKDFNFYESGYLKYSHEFLFKYLKIDINNLFAKNIFPSKEIYIISDYPNNQMNFEDVKFYYSELITNHGSIFGKFIIFENGVLFISDYEKDKRNDSNYLDYVLSTTKYDFLKKPKKIFLDYNKINEIINRTFCFHWNSQEFFMKNGKSYFFNFFKVKYNEEIFDIYKSKLKKLKNIIIQNPKEFFEKEEYTKKYKDNEITTYEYLLSLNKYSSRTYNNLTEYPIMPWINYDKSIRDFDLPMCLQSEESKLHYEDKYNKFKSMDMDIAHNNHYSNAPYVYYYLLRINPFTNDMIKFQGNTFEIPERQFVSVEGTILICPKTGNNREPIPEIFEMPEMYYNINYNDLGKLKGIKRIHNISLSPYAENGIEFCYDLLDKINYNLEINSNINKWIDFIFGVNQFNNEQNSKEILLKKFSDEFYAQNSKFEKQIAELKEQKMDEKKIYSTIKSNIDSPLNFGLCPVQILNEATPKKNIINHKLDINENKKEEKLELNENENKLYRNKIIYFSKNTKNKSIYIFYESGLLYFLSPIKNQIKESYLPFSLKVRGLLYPNLNARFLFCELKDNFFIFCGFLDKTLKFYYNDKNEFSYLLNIYTTSILSINEKEFVTGHSNGNLIKWELENSLNNNKTDYTLNKKIELKSNKNEILSIEYEQKLNILLTSDNNSIIIRNYYNFEFLTCIKIDESISQINKIIKTKIFDCNLIYVLVKLNKNKLCELHCYSLNGSFNKKIFGNFNNFDLTKNGNIITFNLDNQEIIAYKGCHMNKIFTKNIEGNNQNMNEFLFEYPNILYLCSNDNGYTTVNKITMNKMEEKYLNNND